MIRWLAPLFLASATLQALAQPLAEPLWREDLAQFREQFLDRDHAFSVEARAQATQQLAVLHDRTGEVDTCLSLIHISGAQSRRWTADIRAG